MGPTTKPLKNLDLLAAIAIDTKAQTGSIKVFALIEREWFDDLNFHQLGDACLLRTPNLWMKETDQANTEPNLGKSILETWRPDRSRKELPVDTSQRMDRKWISLVLCSN